MEQLLAENERISRDQASRLEGLVSELQDQKTLLEATLNNLADGVVVANPEGVFTRHNPAVARILGGSALGPPGEAIEVFEYFRPDGCTPFPEEDLPLGRALRGEAVEGEEFIVRHRLRPEGVFIVASASPLLAEDGRSMGAVAIFHDVSDRKRWEKTLEAQLTSVREKNELLEQMQMAIQELSTPVLELWDDILALPVIGIVDSKRSAEMMERLLDEVVRRQSQFVIIDITGVELVDTATADRFIKLVTAVEYLGARCMLTGTRGAVAQTLASLGVDMGQLISLRTLKHGLRECLRLMDDPGRRLKPRALLEKARA
ncbi:MAG: STAS domain-containing protein [Byssovorax sp.]